MPAPRVLLISIRSRASSRVSMGRSQARSAYGEKWGESIGAAVIADRPGAPSPWAVNWGHLIDEPTSLSCDSNPVTADPTSSWQPT